MVFANCRRRIPLIGSLTWGKLRWSGDPIVSVKGKRVLLLVHGIRETESRLKAVYSEILSRATASHDVGVGFIWPGGSTLPLWPITVGTAVVPSAQALRDAVLAVHAQGPRSIDINCHSLGCAVTMQSLLQAGDVSTKIRNVYMMSPAMDRDLGDYMQQLRHGQVQVHVCWSRDDIVLDTYRLWPPNHVIFGALGKHGPLLRDMLALPLLHSYDFTGLIGHSHGGYRRVSAYYQMMILGGDDGVATNA